MLLRATCVAALFALPMSAQADSSKTDAELERVFYLSAVVALEAALPPAARDHSDDTWKFRKTMADAARDYDRASDDRLVLR